MLLGFVMLFVYLVVVWLVFSKFKLMKFNIAWGIISASVGLHLLIIFLIGLRFVTPQATDARIVQHTIQLIPRLSEPTLVTGVLVKPNSPIKKGDPLFQFDRRPYEYKVQKLEAALAEAKQNVLVMKADAEVTAEKVTRLQSQLKFTEYQKTLAEGLATSGAGSEEEAQRWAAQLAAEEAGIKEAQAEHHRAVLQYEAEINGVNTAVAEIEAELALAKYYLNNTLMTAPEDGYIMNLQVRPGMVAGEVRFGAIATFICDEGRYLLANFFQENLKYVKEGQHVEAAIDLYPGQIFDGEVLAIWQGSGLGQMLPTGQLPRFDAQPADVPQGQFAVAIRLDDPDQSKFPIGTQGRAAIYTNPSSGFAALRKIEIRAYSWFNWLYPFSG